MDSLYHMLQPEFGCSRKRVHRHLRLAGIVSGRHRAYKVTTNSRHSYPPAPNLLQRKFSFDQPNQAWVSDITYIPTGEGWLYPSIVKDLCARKIVGYACSERIDTSLTPEALHLAVRRCKPPKGFVFHSDRASSTPLGPSGSALSSMKFGRACPQGRSLRQRRGRKFLQMSQVRADPSQTVSHPGQRTGRCIRLLGWLSSVRFEANLPPSCAA